MKLIALIILVLAVHCESLCTRTAFVQKRLKDIADEELKNLLKLRVEGIKDNDCTMTYQARFDNEEIPFYPFFIKLQNKEVFGAVQMYNAKYIWTEWNSEQFRRFYGWCQTDRFILPSTPREPLPENLECGSEM